MGVSRYRGYPLTHLSTIIPRVQTACRGTLSPLWVRAIEFYATSVRPHVEHTLAPDRRQIAPIVKPESLTLFASSFAIIVQLAYWLNKTRAAKPKFDIHHNNARFYTISTFLLPNVFHVFLVWFLSRILKMKIVYYSEVLLFHMKITKNFECLKWKKTWFKESEECYSILSS